MKKSRDELEKENKRLKERLSRLAADKSRFQLVSSILTDIAAVQGLENIVLKAVNSIMNALGGMNVILYYRTGNGWHCCDIAEGIKDLSTIDDPDVLRSIEKGIFVEADFYAYPGSEIKIDGLKNTVKSWTYPLESGGHIFGAVKMEGVFLEYSEDIRNELVMITGYLAFSLWNEINSSGRLSNAYEALKDEMDKRNREEIRYRNTIESSFEGFWIIDIQGNFLEVNDTYCRMTGYDKDEILKMKIPDIEVNDSEADVEKRMERIIQNGMERFESRHRCRDGSEIDVEINITYSPYYSDTFFVFIRDTTWKKKEEAEKEALEKQLQHAQKSEAIGTLAGGIAHDFNNLLVPLIGYSELLLREIPEDSKSHGKVLNILKASERARDLVQQILMFSRKNEDERIMVDINKVADEAVILLSASIPKSVDLKFEPAESSINIIADPSQIHQVLINLVTNAFHAVERNQKGQIRVSVYNKKISSGKGGGLRTPPGDYAVIKVSDNGTGINKETLDKIFDPYFTTKNRGKGTGLGLAVVQGIVKSHGGSLSVESSEGKGSDFFVYFPVPLRTAGSKNQHSSEMSDFKMSGNGNILIVDDESYILDIEADILENLGYSVVKAEGPVAALDIFRKSERAFDLLITDMTMPFMSGADLAHKLRKINPSLPVIICTGYSEKISPQNKELFGINEVLMKPLGSGILARTVNQILSGEESF